MNNVSRIILLRIVHKIHFSCIDQIYSKCTIRLLASEVGQTHFFHVGPNRPNQMAY